MVQPTERCLKYVQETGAELWIDEDGTYFVVYPDVRTAHVHGLDVYGLFEVYDVGMFEVRSISKSILRNLSGVRKIA